MMLPRREVLPDVLGPGLKLVICGSAAGVVSAREGAYYAGPGNKFWPTLHAVGLTPHRLAPADFKDLLKFGIGLTDMAKYESGADTDLSRLADNPVAVGAKLDRFRPRAIAFNGKRAASVFFGEAVGYGRQPDWRDIAVFVLPSTSGAANVWWDIEPWHGVARFVNERSPPS